VTDKALFQAFLKLVCERETPTNPMARVMVFAKELAEGAAMGVWLPYILSVEKDLKNKRLSEHLQRSITLIQDHIRQHHHAYWLQESPAELCLRLQGIFLAEEISFKPYEYDPIIKYILARWGFAFPPLELLRVNGYVTMHDYEFVITKTAFDLLQHAEPASIFISYKRTESSAFALLIATKLKQAGLDPFIDMALVPGDNWQASLKKRIEQSDYQIVLLGQETLKSQVTLQEISWALDANVTIIPIWHHGFTYQSGAWDTIPMRIDKLLTTTHTIRVMEENPLAYNTALAELLNRFGVTP
jgi:hypothetical protein